MSGRVFDLGTLLSITTGTLLTKIGNVYKILDYMTGESNFTHMLPGVSKMCAPVILRQHPKLVEISAAGIDQSNWKEFLDKQIQKYGNAFEIIPLKPSQIKDKYNE
jgi:hypothetical protein